MSSKKMMLAICLLFTFVALGATASRPIMVIELFRHGARAAFAPTWDVTKAWDGIYGELTNAGMRQQYLLGQSVAKDYSDLLLPYNPSQLEVYSTDVNRTIMSAYSHLYGMFSPGTSNITDYQNKTALPPGLEGYNFTEFINDTFALPKGIQPVPVHIKSRVRDYALAPEQGCRTFNNISQNTLRNSSYQEFQTIMNSTTQLIISYATQFNITLTDIWSYQSLADILIANYFENIPAPVNITYGTKEWDDLIFYNNWVVAYMYTGQLQTRQLSSVNLFDRMFSQLKGKLNGSFNKTFSILSAHDTTLLPMLSTLGLVTTECLRDVYIGKIPQHDCEFPEYSANIITELYNDTAKPYVKIRYNGLYKNVCNTTDNTCDLEAYQKLVSENLHGYNTTNYLQDCGISSQVDPNPPKPNPPNPDDSQRSTLIVLIIVLGIVCLVELAVLLFMLLRKGKKAANIVTQPNDQSLISHP